MISAMISAVRGRFFANPDQRKGGCVNSLLTRGRGPQYVICNEILSFMYGSFAEDAFSVAILA